MISIIINFILLLPVIIFLANADAAKNKGKVHLYGIYGFFGLAGKGKTMCVKVFKRYAAEIRQ